jgi:AcrR family transcriptional regulator
MVQTLADPVRSFDRRQEILRAASELFRHHGVAGAGMREIAAACGMQVGNLYYYFENKQALVAYCQEQSLTGLLGTAEWAAGLARPADTRLVLLLVAHVRRLNEWSPGSLAHLEAEGLEGEARRRLLEARERYTRALEQVVREGQAEGIFAPELDPRLVVLGALGAMNWSVRWFRPDGPRDAASVGHELASTAVRGALAEGRRLEAPSTAELVELARVATQERMEE